MITHLLSARRTRGALLPALITASLFGCDSQADRLVLPPGDAEQGVATFAEVGCNQCHSVHGSVDLADDSATGIHVVLGGQVTKVKTHANLVTSIINPSHVLSRGTTSMTVTDFGESRMPSFNANMTVEQLVDITMFLQRTYSITPPPYQLYYP